MRGADGRFKRVLTVSSREQQGAARFKRPRRSADALAAAESRGECTAVHEPRKPQPEKADEELRKGHCLYDKDVGAAIIAYRHAIWLDPGCAAAHIFLGDLLLDEHKDVAGAESAYRDAIAADPTCADAHNNLGYLLQYERKDVPGAESAYRDAIAANPKLVEAHNNLEYLLNNMKNFN